MAEEGESGGAWGASRRGASFVGGGRGGGGGPESEHPNTRAVRGEGGGMPGRAGRSGWGGGRATGRSGGLPRQRESATARGLIS